MSIESPSGPHPARCARHPLPSRERGNCLAQTQDAAPAPAPPPATNAEASIHGYGDRDKTCLSWTDTCRHCERGDDGAIFCSNIGIACQPAEITCTRRSEAAK
jgi:hypothetical protein